MNAELTPDEALDFLIKTNISPENAREPLAVLRRALAPKVIAKGWARLCHEAAGKSDFCDLEPHKPEWEFFTWKAPRSIPVLLIEAP